MAFHLFNRFLVEGLSQQNRKCGVNLLLSSGYSMKSNLPIKWIRPEKIPCFKPEKSGDLKPLISVDKTQFAPEFRDLEELQSADENVKKLFSLEYQPYKKTVSVLREEYLKKVRRHVLDFTSPEARVAKMTADIRDMQRFMEEFPRDKRTKVRLKETIDKRKRLLKCLRTWDYKCYEYVLEKLDLVFKASPGPDVWKRIERKRSLRMLTTKYCEDIVSSKLSQYQEHLESQQEDFLVEKIKTLKWIMEQEAFCGTPQTVTDQCVKDVEEKLETLRKKKQKDNVVIND